MPKWFRTCQECGYVHSEEIKEGQRPNPENPRFTEKKCPKCKSIGFDYGGRTDPRLPATDY